MKKRLKKDFYPFYKFYLVFLIGGFVGNVIETIFCRLSMGSWMNRSGLIIEPISIVWGLGIAIITSLFYHHQNKPKHFLFLCGFFIGAIYEYLCSIFTEYLFGTKYWDYSKYPFNIQGRINLLFCVYWGLFVLIYVKLILPKIDNLIEKIKPKKAVILSYTLFIIFLIDLCMTCCALIRFQERNDHIEASSYVSRLFDKYADDNYMHRRWPNMKSVK